LSAQRRQVPALKTGSIGRDVNLERSPVGRNPGRRGSPAPCRPPLNQEFLERDFWFRAGDGGSAAGGGLYGGDEGELTS
jgi:hypothetical protein